MSAREELKAKSAKRFQKRELRHLQKSKSKRSSKDDIVDDDDMLMAKKFLPTPSALNSLETGIKSRKSANKEREQQKKSQTPIGSKFLPDLIFADDLQPIDKASWKGPPGEDPPSEGLKTLRKDIGVVVKGSLLQCPPPVLSIQDPFLPPSFQAVFKSLNISVPTPVQMQCWPAILAGANVLGIAPTGSGKTIAYCLPVITHVQSQIAANLALSKKSKAAPQSGRIAPMGLILVPTRELAIQVTATLKPLKRLCSIFSAAVFGGQDKEEQLDKLSANGGQLHVLVATPGRLLDFITNSRLLMLSKVTYLVIDEADRMLTMGFFDQLSAISGQIRPDRQTLLFSATFPGRLREIADTWVINAVVIRCNAMEFKDNGKLKKTAQPTPLTAEEEGNNNDDAVESGAADSSKVSKKRVCDEGVVTTADGTVFDSMLPVAKKSKKDQQAVVDDSTTEDNVVTPATEESAAVQSADDSLVVIAPTLAPFAKNFSTSLTISKTVAQSIHVCASHKKPRILMKYIARVRESEKEEKLRQPGAMIVFCNKIKTLGTVHEFLTRNNIKVELLHGQLQQNIREATLSNFKAGKINILIATDVAARGIHIKRLRYVVNYDFPTNIEQYCHRVGRTGRQGETGSAYSLITRNMGSLAHDLIALLKVCDQVPEANLLKLAEDFSAGLINEKDDIVENDDE